MTPKTLTPKTRWLVDALQNDGYTVRLVNTAAVVVYDGLKYSGDIADARHLAHLLRMNLLPCGYIYPKEPRALRDLARKRAQLVQQRTTLHIFTHGDHSITFKPIS